MKKLFLIICFMVCTTVHALDQNVIISSDNVVLLNGVFNDVHGVQIDFKLSEGTFKNSDITLTFEDNAIYTVDGNNLSVYIYSNESLNQNSAVLIGEISIKGDYKYESTALVTLIDENLETIENMISVTGNTSKIIISTDNSNVTNSGSSSSNSSSNSSSGSSTGKDSLASANTPQESLDEVDVDNTFDLMMTTISKNIFDEMIEANKNSDIYVNFDDLTYIFYKDTLSYDGESIYDFGYKTTSANEELFKELLEELYIGIINFNSYGDMPLSSGSKAVVKLNLGEEYSNTMIYYYLYNEYTEDFTLIDYNIADQDGVLSIKQNKFGTYVLTNNVISENDEVYEDFEELYHEEAENNKKLFYTLLYIVIFITFVSVVIHVVTSKRKY